ncbi:unnamed protein product [Lactuca virosa]|uniref:Uncharacterized protein n=1 Tax=Lactuca virosa TaxID=75947 RepID=A0AAU9N5N9_9ASTR|nr:unnamed protein product [Lactuca virosa]
MAKWKQPPSLIGIDIGLGGFMKSVFKALLIYSLFTHIFSVSSTSPIHFSVLCLHQTSLDCSLSCLFPSSSSLHLVFSANRRRIHLLRLQEEECQEREI